MTDKDDETFRLRLVTDNSSEADYAIKELVTSFNDAKIMSKSFLSNLCIYKIELLVKHRQEFMLKATYHEMVKNIY